MPIGPGQTLLHYRLVEKIGEGGMGEVWVAEDTKLGRRVALKTLPSSKADDEERRQRFEREARTVAALNHPNIVTLHSIEEDSGVSFLTMELVGGESLGQRVPDGGLALTDLFEIAIQLADAVGAAHGAGIVHRDLKPDNVMVTDEGRVKVLDFGLAKLAEETTPPSADQTQGATASITQEGKILGTINYMSPEQAEGKTVDARSDVFALGVILYQMTTGQRPFRGDTAISTISSNLKENPPSITELNRAAPRHLGRIVERCLAKDPERRYGNAKEVRNELEALRNEVTSSGSVETPPTAETKPRGPLIIGLAIAALLVVIVSGWVWLGRIVKPAPRAAPVVQAEKSIAVLPFADLSAEGDQEYFADGISEELISGLAKIDGLRVAGRTSSFAFKGQQTGLREIGEQLGVDTILEGSVRRAGNRVRIAAQLTNSTDGFQLWSETYERELADIFTVQDEIAGSIARALEVVLETGSGSPVELAGGGTDDVEAYQLYLRGRHLWHQRTVDSLTRSVALFEEAIERDPEFAGAHTGLALTHVVIPGYMPVDYDAVGVAQAAAERALQLDPMQADAHAALGEVNTMRGHWLTAQRAYLRALEIGPRNSTALFWLGSTNLLTGRLDAARKQIGGAYEIDPAWGVINGWMGILHRLQGDHDTAFEYVHSAAELGWGAATNWIVSAHLAVGQGDRALQAVAGPDSTWNVEAARVVVAAREDPSKTSAALELVRDEPAIRRIQIYIFLDRPELAVELLGNLDPTANGYMAWVFAWDVAAGSLRRHPDFSRLVEAGEFIEYWNATSWPEFCRPAGDGVECR